MRVIFFSGSSSVGKSETLATLSDNKYIKAPLSARDARATIGNPNWDDLKLRPAAWEHQVVVLNWFIAQIQKQIVVSKGDMLSRDVVFERSMWDVVGYSHAFDCGYSFVAEQVSRVHELEQDFIEQYPDIQFSIVYFPINPLIPYKAIEARPPIIIRERQDNWLNMFLKEETAFKYADRLMGENIETCIASSFRTD